MKWTKEQENAISFRGKNAIVSAAAGSGKTAVLVERIMRIISDEENKTPADSLAVMTFTKKAAEELRVRLQKALEKSLSEQPKNDYLKEQLIALEDASISTISSFCLDILRENAGLLEVSPGFAVLDQSEEQLLCGEAMKQTLEEIYNQREKPENRLLISWYCGTDDSRLSDYILSLYEATRNIPDGEDWLKEQADFYGGKNGGMERLLSEMNANAVSCIRTAYKEIIGIDDFMTEGMTEKAQASIAAAQDYIGRWEKIKDFTSAQNRPLMLALLFEKLPPKNPIKDFEVKGIRDYAYEQMNRAFEIVHKLISGFDDGAQCYPVLEALIGAEKEFERQYARLKREKNAVDFSDIELMTYRLLSDGKGGKSTAAEELSQRLSNIIVDEFQDSNKLQYAIFKLISRGDNLYFVGDIKQSIYKFRGADPTVFAELLKDRSFEPLLLNRNFRSNGCVVDSVNAVFEGLMCDKLGNAEYNDKTRLIMGNTAVYNDNTQSDENMTEVVLLDKESETVTECSYVARRIREYVDSGFKVTEKDGSQRPCSYGDFAILIRSGIAREGKAFAESLKTLNIPSAVKNGSDFTDRTEIMLMMDLLTVIDNPYNDTAMADVLLSPLYGFDEGTLAMMKNKTFIYTDSDGNDNAGRYISIYSALSAMKDADPRCKRVYDDLSRLRVYMANNSVENLVRHIFDATDILRIMRSTEKGDMKAANLRKLLRYVKLFSGADSCLSDFIAYVERMKKNEVQLEEADSAEGGADAVSIMTVHGSKGLEFPVVFVVNTHKKFNFSDSYAAVIADNSTVVGMQIIDRERMIKLDTAFHDYAAEAIKNDERSQALRLLYVALTRAREKLIVTAALKPKKDGGENTFETSDDTWINWINCGVSRRPAFFELSSLYKSDEAAEETAEEEPCGSFEESPDLSGIIAENLSRKYGYERFASIPAKVTVTEVGVENISERGDFLSESGNEEESRLFLVKPAFALKSDKMTGKERGDAYHKVFELISWQEESAEGQLKRLLEAGRINQREYDCVKAEDVQLFMDSALGQRIRNCRLLRREQPLFTEVDPKLMGFEAEEGDRPFVQGIADMFFIEEDGAVLVDYKTNVRVTEEDLYREYFGQLDIYAKAISEITGLPVKERFIWSVYLGKAVDMRERRF